MKELEKKIFDYLKAHEEDIIADIETLAKAESPTADKAACDACARVLAGLYKDRIGVTTELVPSEKSGDNLVSVYGEGDKTLLIVGHYDTVHPVGSVPLRREGNVLYGPGVCDMKGGDVMAIWALKALKELGVKLDKRVMVINNSDEETGSDNSRPLMLEKAKDCFACIVCEPAFGVEGKIKVARKGGGSIRIKCYGKAAHAGNNPADGVKLIHVFQLGGQGYQIDRFVAAVQVHHGLKHNPVGLPVKVRGLQSGSHGTDDGIIDHHGAEHRLLRFNILWDFSILQHPFYQTPLVLFRNSLPPEACRGQPKLITARTWGRDRRSRPMHRHGEPVCRPHASGGGEVQNRYASFFFVSFFLTCVMALTGSETI